MRSTLLAALGWATGSGGAPVVVVGCVLGAAAAMGAAVWVVPAAPTADAGSGAVVAPVELRSWITAPSEKALKAPDPASSVDPAVGRSEHQDRAGTGGDDTDSSGEDKAGTGVEDTDSSGEDTAGGSDLRSAQGRVYSWHDGDRVLEAVLQSDLVVPRGEVIASTADIVRRSASPGGDPVFRDASGGTLMALPGGVVLVLDPRWGPRQVAEFFAGNAISKSAVSELGFAPNGFLIDTDAGLDSLRLANRLAVEDGVELSSPNWWRETASR